MKSNSNKIKTAILILLLSSPLAKAQKSLILPVKSAVVCSLNYGSEIAPIDLTWNGNQAGIMSGKANIKGVDLELLVETQFNPEITGFLKLPGVAPGRNYKISFSKPVSEINPAEFTSRIVYHLTDTDRTREIYVICERTPGTY